MAKTQETPAVKKDGRLVETAEISERAEILQALRLPGIHGAFGIDLRNTSWNYGVFTSLLVCLQINQQP